MKTDFSVRSSIIISIFLATVGCAHSPFSQEWEWKRPIPGNHIEEVIAQNNAKMAKIRQKHPDWDQYLSDETVQIYCEINNLQAICTGK